MGLLEDSKRGASREVISWTPKEAAYTSDFGFPLNSHPGRNILLFYSSEEEMGSEKVITLSHRQDQSQACTPVLCGYEALLDPNLSRLPPSPTCGHS